MPSPLPAETTEAAMPRRPVNHLMASTVSGTQKALTPAPTSKPKVRQSCHTCCTWLDSTRPAPSRTAPTRTTRRVLTRSETQPDTTPPAPITIQLKSPMAPMPERLQPIDSSIGFRKTPSVKRVPIDMLMTMNAAPRTTHRYIGHRYIGPRSLGCSVMRSPLPSRAPA